MEGFYRKLDGTRSLLAKGKEGLSQGRPPVFGGREWQGSYWAGDLSCVNQEIPASNSTPESEAVELLLSLDSLSWGQAAPPGACGSLFYLFIY